MCVVHEEPRAKLCKGPSDGPAWPSLPLTSQSGSTAGLAQRREKLSRFCMKASGGGMAPPSTLAGGVAGRGGRTAQTHGGLGLRKVRPPGGNPGPGLAHLTLGVRGNEVRRAERGVSGVLPHLHRGSAGHLCTLRSFTPPLGLRAPGQAQRPPGNTCPFAPPCTLPPTSRLRQP